jgi:hypothetical protein
MSLPSRLAAWLLLCCTALVIGELGARVVFPRIEVANFDRGLYTDDVARTVLEHGTLAHASFLVESTPDSAKSVHQLNLYGFRDREWPLAKSNLRRLFVVGDSMTEGFLVAEEQTPPRVLERLLRQDGQQVEVWNLGVSASGPEQYGALVQDAVPVFRPDEILFVFYVNDLLGIAPFEDVSGRPRPRVIDAHSLRLWEVARDVFRGRPVPMQWHRKPFQFFAAVPHPINPWTQRERELSQQVDPDIAVAMRAGHFNPFNVNEVVQYEHYLQQPGKMLPWLTAMKRFLDGQGVPFRIALIPQAGQTSDHYRQFKQRFGRGGTPSLMDERLRVAARNLARDCLALRIPFMDTTDAIRNEEAAGRHLYWNHDEHMRPEGDAFVAGELRKFRQQK